VRIVSPASRQATIRSPTKSVSIQTFDVNVRFFPFREVKPAVNGISEGNGLRIAAQDLGIPINTGFPGLISLETATAPVEFGG
jgi:hypothetical protein